MVSSCSTKTENKTIEKKRRSFEIFGPEQDPNHTNQPAPNFDYPDYGGHDHHHPSLLGPSVFSGPPPPSGPTAHSISTHTIITKRHGYPVPYPVHVDRHIPYPVKVFNLILKLNSLLIFFSLGSCSSTC